MRLFSLFKPRAVKKAVRYLRLLGPRLLIHAVMEKLRGRTFHFYNEERIMQDRKTMGYTASGLAGAGIATPGQVSIHDIKPISAEKYKVSIIIPSDNFDNITQCVESLIENTSYPNYEIVVVTNSDVADLITKSGLDCFAAARNDGISKFRIHHYDKPFNFSEKCNEGAAAATGNVLCFYNDDIRPIDSDWIEQMLQALLLPNVGGVTPLQMLDDKLVLTAGNVLGTPGLQTFAFSGARYTPPRHLRPNQFMVRDVSVLSGACLLIKRDVFNEIGTFNAEKTPNSFSDTEISLKMRDSGYHSVISPNARMLHDNKNSWRKADKPDKAFQYMIEKWGEYFSEDVFFNDKLKTQYKIAPPPHIYKYYAPESILPRKPGGRDILFVSHDLHRSGAPSVLMDMVKVVMENGDRPVVVSLVDGPLRQEYLDMGITVIIDNSICDMTDSGAFAFDYVARNFDLVVVNTLACWRVIEVMSDSMPPVLWWIHESTFAINLFKDSLPDSLADNIKAYAVSDYSADSLKNAGIAYALGRLSSGMPDYSKTKEKTPPTSAMLFLILGSIEYTKGQDVLVHALEMLDKDTQSKVEFVIIGTSNDDDIMALCKNAAEKYDNFSLLGSMPREQLSEWYEKADCLIIPSREDTLSLVGLEAMMLSVPIISSKNVGLAGYLAHNENGLVFPSEDSEALAEQIAYAVNNREKMVKMGSRARKEVYEKHFTMEMFRKNALQAIDSVINKR